MRAVLRGRSRPRAHRRGRVVSLAVATAVVLGLLLLLTSIPLLYKHPVTRPSAPTADGISGDQAVVRETERRTAVRPQRAEECDLAAQRCAYASVVAGGFSNLSYPEAVDLFQRHVAEKPYPGTIEQSTVNFVDFVAPPHKGVLLHADAAAFDAAFPVDAPPGGWAAANDSLARAFVAVARSSPLPWSGEGQLPPRLRSMSRAEVLQEVRRERERFTDVEVAPFLDRGGGGGGDVVDGEAPAAYCDPYDADFSPTTDAACRRYLSNPRNWLSLAPMSSILLSGRTIKFKLHYKHHNVTAVLKVSQKKFVLEPISEVVAYHVDRMLGFYRVPPTVYLPFPVDMLKAAAATHHSRFYSNWVDQFVLDQNTSRAPVLPSCRADAPHLMEAIRGRESESDAEDPGEGLLGLDGACVRVSIQLWMYDVDLVVDTSLLGPGSLNMAALYVLPRKATTLRPTPSAPPDTAAAEVWEVLAFDAVIGNRDRWMGHNMFAVAACRPQDVCARRHWPDAKRYGELPSKSSPRILFLDQGSGFYQSGVDKKSFFATSEGAASAEAGGVRMWCRMRADTMRRLHEVVTLVMEVGDGTAPSGDGAAGARGGRRFPIVVADASDRDAAQRAAAQGQAVSRALYQMLHRRLPEGTGTILPPSLVQAACTRVWYLMLHEARCLAEFGEAEVLSY